jgi:hypothetical protein
MWLVYLILIYGSYLLIALILKWTVISNGKRSERSSRKKLEPRVQVGPSADRVTTPITASEKSIDIVKKEEIVSLKKPSQADLILEAIKKKSTRPPAKEGEKYYTPEDTEQERQITKEVEAFNRDIKVQNKTYQKDQ